MDEHDLIQPFGETLYDEGIEEITKDIAEIAIDDLSSMVFEGVSETFLRLPIIKWAVSIGKFGWSVRNAVALRNQLTFIQSLKNNTPNPDEIEKRCVAFRKREKWIIKEIETSVIYLERYTNTKKAQYQAKIYCSLVNGEISFSQYEEYLSILDQIFLIDVEHFLDIVDYYARNNKSFYDQSCIRDTATHFNPVQCRRLESLGLIQGLITTRTGISTVDRYEPTEQGYHLYSVFREENDTHHAKISFSSIR